MTAESNRLNRLSREKSPYLLQHASNPVDWFPWGDEAFERARRENKPIFLSIGYSTCHWCHVMEEESFTQEGIARILNEFFVSIKVDREERPDVDHVYMDSVMAMTGSGGWPLSVFLTPEREPFYGGTYFPPEDRYGRPGFVTVLMTLARRWAEDEKKIRSAGRDLARALSEHAAAARPAAGSVDRGLLDKAQTELAGRFDARFGGFGSAPKFPTPHLVSMLLIQSQSSSEAKAEALAMAEKTLSAMAQGGICDHLGGGFHRYSTDERWHVPHFEKMLYDQALISRAYTDAFELTRNPFYETIAREITEYVLREMTGAEGAFYSAEDADSARDASKPDDKSEGAFYVWTAREIRELLSPEEFSFAEDFFGLEETGNVHEDPHGEFKGVNVLRQARPLEETAVKMGLSMPQGLERWSAIRAKLHEFRKSRPRPHRDDKILTDWNALMISSLAQASRVFAEPRYEEAARRSLDYLLTRMRGDNGALYHSLRQGASPVEGFLDDYVFFLGALYDVYQACYDIRCLEEARPLMQRMIDEFRDQGTGGFYFSSSLGEKLFCRPKPTYDGALPSGNSYAVGVLARWGRLLRDSSLERTAHETLQSLSGLLAHHPSHYGAALAGLDYLLAPGAEIIIAGPRQNALVQYALRESARLPGSRRVVLYHPLTGPEAARMEALLPWMKSFRPQREAAVYVCRNFSCAKPIETLEQALSGFEELRKFLGGSTV